MTKWKPAALSPRGPVYLAIADALAQDISAGKLASGERLPTHRELARTLGVNVVTVTRAYAEAARRGLVEGEVGRGTFVQSLETRSNSELSLLRPEHGLIDFHFNLPRLASDALDLQELYGALARDGFHPLQASYDPGGEEPHRCAGARWIEHVGASVDKDRILVTHGGQQAMTVAFAALADPGDVILTGELTYPGMKALASVLHLRTVPVAMDAAGLRPEALEEACRKLHPKALYCMPTLQNPTGIVWPEDRRRAIVEVAERYGVAIVEDDTTAFLESDPPAPLAELAPELVWFVSSTSKSLGAGLRVGYLLVPPSTRNTRLQRAASIQAAISWMTPPLMAEIATRLIEGGEARRIVQKKRDESRARRKLFDRHLGDTVRTSTARACSFVWVYLPEPWRSADFAAEAQHLGVAVNPAETFVVGRGHAPHAARLCLGTPRRRAQVDEGLQRLARLFERAPEVCRSLV